MELRLLEDTFAGGDTLALPDDGINRILYVAHGGIKITGAQYDDDASWHGRGAAHVGAGAAGAAVWRFELAPQGSAPIEAKGGTRLKLSSHLAWPLADALLMRNDSVSFPSGGCAFLHTHQGPGIRCLIDGGIRIDTEGHSASYAPGGAWFEAGPEPVFAQAAPDRPTRFIRVMILPARLLGQSSIAYVNAEDRDKPKSQKYKGYVDALIEV